ncbi:MAG: hypothetical protein ACFFCZ_19940 [Promethearchaeota archaeon]
MLTLPGSIFPFLSKGIKLQREDKMRKMAKRISCVVFVLCILLSVMAGITLGLARKNYMLNVKLEDAYYLDGDTDGWEDDVFVLAKASFDGYKKVVHLRIFLELTLPSGAIHDFTLNTKCYSYGVYQWDILTLNTATEPGWYIAHLRVEMYCWKAGHPIVVEDSLEFDPPTAKTNGSPLCLLKTTWLGCTRPAWY